MSHKILKTLISLCFCLIFLEVKRVTWPPEHEYQARAASLTRQSPAFQSQVSTLTRTRVHTIR